MKKPNISCAEVVSAIVMLLIIGCVLFGMWKRDQVVNACINGDNEACRKCAVGNGSATCGPLLAAREAEGKRP